jgi:hypothetical protein
MIDYKYPTIASGATPIGSAGRAPDEELLREERGRKFRVHYRWQAPENKLDISLPSGERIQELDDFGYCISQVEIEEIEDLKKLKFEEAEDI